MRSMTLVIPVYRPDDRFKKLLKRTAGQIVKPDRLLVMLTLQPDWPAAADAKTETEQLSGTEGTSAETAQEKKKKKMLVSSGITKAGIESRIVPVRKQEFDHGGTRDLAARMTDTDLLVYMTMDALPADRRLFETLDHAFDDPAVACAYARQLPERDAGVLERYTRSFNYPPQSVKKSAADLETLGIKTFFCSNVCAAYRRDIYMELGGFEKHTIFNEDMIFAGKAVQAGCTISYEAGARVLHSHNYTGLQQLHRNFDLGVSQAEHPEVFGLTASESEGVHMILDTAGCLIRSGRPYLLPRLIWQSGCKYLGYRLGKAWRKLPPRLVRQLTMNREYWNRM